jgi:hypothetical protein
MEVARETVRLITVEDVMLFASTRSHPVLPQMSLSTGHQNRLLLLLKNLTLGKVHSVQPIMIAIARLENAFLEKATQLV